MAVELILIRHGQSNWNVERRCQGSLDQSQLTPLGLEQAHALARDLQGIEFAALYTSSQQRALQTSEIIAAAIGMSIQVDERLGEMDQGQWQGLTFPEIEQVDGENYRRFSEDPTLVTPPGGESIQQVAHRMRESVSAMAARYKGQRVAVVSHEIPLGALYCLASCQPLNQVWKLAPPNGHYRAIMWPPPDHGMLTAMMRWFSARFGFGGTS